MNDDNVTKRVFEKNLEDRRRRGRPKLRWKDSVLEDYQKLEKILKKELNLYRIRFKKGNLVTTFMTSTAYYYRLLWNIFLKQELIRIFFLVLNHKDYPFIPLYNKLLG